ncbi:hypothetical protein Bca101_081632 [Brassica carinata]
MKSIDKSTVTSDPITKKSNGKIGKILTHRENNDGRQLIYEKLPNDIASLDHVLALGSYFVVTHTKSYKQRHLKGFTRSQETSTGTSEVDASLNEDSRVIPGLGEFTDCYFAKNEGRSGALTVSQDKERIYGAKAMVKIYDDPCYNIQNK